MSNAFVRPISSVICRWALAVAAVLVRPLRLSKLSWKLNFSSLECQHDTPGNSLPFFLALPAFPAGFGWFTTGDNHEARAILREAPSLEEAL